MCTNRRQTYDGTVTYLFVSAGRGLSCSWLHRGLGLRLVNHAPAKHSAEQRLAWRAKGVVAGLRDVDAGKLGQFYPEHPRTRILV